MNETASCASARSPVTVLLLSFGRGASGSGRGGLVLGHEPVVEDLPTDQQDLRCGSVTRRSQSTAEVVEL
ncbi:hypothetical protein [Streptomyces virginiae]|uniref:hypothetical protein n=1 Tax=Streptomyces virginiae TaxID=1961 RepID=UPI003868D38C|nr:hypothetical protein OG253_09275 [Streptomyces virginiae]